MKINFSFFSFGNKNIHSIDGNYNVKETFDYNPSPQVKVPADRTRAAQVKDKGDISMSTVREFPTELAQRIKKLFPAARTMGEALAAYVYLKEGEPEDIRISSEIASVAKSYIGDTVTPKDVQEELMKELLRMREMNNKAMRKLNSIELGVSYALFDRLGFRKLETLSPGQLNFLETVWLMATFVSSTAISSSPDSKINIFSLNELKSETTRLLIFLRLLYFASSSLSQS